MGRMEAEDVLDEDAFRDGMESAGVYAGAYPLDEAPDAYKSSELIENAIEPTATVTDHLQVVHNFKADD